MSYLTTSLDGLTAGVIAALEGEGFAYNPLTTSFSKYLATALGEPNAYLTKSVARMLSEIDAQYGGILSHLTSSIAQLLDDVNENIGEGGGGEPAGALLDEDGEPLLDEDSEFIIEEDE